MKHRADYECPTCGAIKEIIHATERTGQLHPAPFPDKVICGWRGCDDYALPYDKPEWNPDPVGAGRAVSDAS